jgi:dienelactone hydrolase
MWKMRRTAVLLFAAVLVLASCGEDTEGARFQVIAEVVSRETTQDMLVFAPDAKGPWPVIVAFHGVGGTAEDMAEIATRLARGGAVVFAPTYWTDISTQKGLEQAAIDVECGYRFARSIAAEHGGALDLPVTFVGWSLGATAALALGLTEEIDPTGEHVTCFSEVPRPDIIVAMSGCHYEYEGRQLDFDTSGWGNKEADLILIAGEKDNECAAWQSQDAAAALRSAGYDVDLVMLQGANHHAPVFHDLQDDQFVVVADDPAGERTVEVILDAIAARQDRT